jgi:hypothetical protein
MKKNGGDEPIGVIIYIYTRKYYKRTPCVATFISNKQKCHFFFLLFSSTKLENRKGEEAYQREGVGTSGIGEVAQKVGRMVNMVQMLFTSV